MCNFNCLFITLSSTSFPYPSLGYHKSNDICRRLISLINANDNKITGSVAELILELNLLYFSILFLTGTGKKGKAADSGPNADEGSSSDCLPCQDGCAYCKDDTPCVTREDGALRLAVLSFQCLCLLIVFVSMVLIYHFRRNKVRTITSSSQTFLTGFDPFIII